MKDIIKEVEQYYTDKIIQHGATPRGVDWNSVESQELRYLMLSKIISNQEDSFSILDYGCGFGGMYHFYLNFFKNFKYTGYDISEKMIEEAKNIIKENENLIWTTNVPEEKYDYVIASGIFNVKFQTNEEVWMHYILETLEKINALSAKGFSFNILTSYSDKEYMKDNLFYADPLFFFDYCKKNFSKNVSLLHDYDLYEFTLLIKK